MCVCALVGQGVMTTTVCALTGGLITASDRASSKTLSEEYTLCMGQNKHPVFSEGAINYLYHCQKQPKILLISLPARLDA